MTASWEKRIFRAKREEVKESWSKLCVEDLHDFCSSLDIVSVIETRRMMIKTGQVPCAVNKRVKLETDLLEELGLHGRIILKKGS
jgi:hypothetical protein